MTRQLAALLLLFAFAAALVAGPHPCHGGSAVADGGGEPARSCHSPEPAAGPPGGPAVSPGGDAGGCSEHGPLCESLCQMAGIVGVEVPGVAIQPLARMAAPAGGHLPPLFADPIDHIPVA